MQTVWLPTLFDQEPAQATPVPLSDTQQSSEPPGRTQGCPEVAAVPRDTERASPLQDAVMNISPSCYSSWGSRCPGLSSGPPHRARWGSRPHDQLYANQNRPNPAW